MVVSFAPTHGESMGVEYHCRSCGVRWVSDNDCWCPECGKITKTAKANVGGKPKPPVKYTKASEKERFKMLKARKYSKLRR